MRRHDDADFSIGAVTWGINLFILIDSKFTLVPLHEAEDESD